MYGAPEIIAGVLALALSTPAALPGQSAPGVDSLRFASPVTLTELDMRNLAGHPARLAWSPDGTQLYMQTLDGDFGKTSSTPHHYVIVARTGAIEPVAIEPEWAADSWVAKSGQRSNDNPPMKIELKIESRQERPTSIPQGGELARGGTSAAMTDNDLISAISTETIGIIMLLLNGEVVGKFENTVLVPGLTYGWGPMGSRVIAFAAQKNGSIIVMDASGTKRTVAGSKNAILPAWSPDGDRLVWLQKAGRTTYALKVSRVSVR
jgi:hypothetical protein